MNKSLFIVIPATILLFSISVIAADKVVVVPLNTCPDGLVKCTGQCVDIMNNPNFCGDCETVCGAGLFCYQGVCKSQIGANCTEHTECLSGKCTTRGSCAPQSKFVFISSAAYLGNLGGLTGADSKCQERAEAAGLPGAYKAWLSDSTGSPATRFTRSTVPYILVDGTEVAANWTDLTDGTLITSLNKRENGQVVSTSVWSNTDAFTAELATASCVDWSSELLTDQGGYGGTYSTESSWTNAGYSYACNSTLPIFCFEQ